MRSVSQDDTFQSFNKKGNAMKKFQNLFSKTQDGRSMVEMLGVLAIIGVLSIGGIAGFNMAMRKYRMNELVDAINKLFVIIQSEGLHPQETEFSISYTEVFGKTPQEGLPNVIGENGFFSAGIINNDDGPCHYVTFSMLNDMKICDDLQNALSNEYSILYCSGDDQYNEAFIVDRECSE